MYKSMPYSMGDWRSHGEKLKCGTTWQSQSLKGGISWGHWWGQSLSCREYLSKLEMPWPRDDRQGQQQGWSGADLRLQEDLWVLWRVELERWSCRLEWAPDLEQRTTEFDLLFWMLVLLWSNCNCAQDLSSWSNKYIIFFTGAHSWEILNF